LEKVSVIVPCRNEIDYIGKFLESLNKQDYPSDLVELILVDGISDDNTREYLDSFVCKGTLVLDNPMQHVSEALNLAIKKASGDIIIRMDVHCVFPDDYISTLVGYLSNNPKVGNVGVPCRTLASGSGLISASIALVLSTSIGVGGSAFRVDSPDEPKSVDTVPFGCWRRSIFALIGHFDTDLVRNQDDEFNQRVLKSGFEIHLLPGPKATYFGRSTLASHMKMFYQYGLFKPLVNKKTGKLTTLRQLAPVALVAFSLGNILLTFVLPEISIICGVISVAAYLIVAPFFLSSYDGQKIKIYIPFVCCLILTHLSYGLGYLKGLFFGLSSKMIGLSR
jgi:glycosyltransferase involved in cell wall biosynthesis